MRSNILNDAKHGFLSDFVDKLSSIVKDLEESAFVSLDGEFTGLASERNIMPFDTSEEYYLKRLKTSQGFILVQLGLTFFKVKKNPANDSEEKVTCNSYNIFVYPQSKNATFHCQGQSLSFLAENGFDFNKLFTEGISYCNAADEEKLRKEIEEKQALRLEQLKQRASNEETDTTGRNFIPIPDNEIELLDKVKGKVQDIVDGKLAETSFEKLNPFQRKLIYELIERDFNNKVSTSVKTIENNQKSFVIQQKRSEEEELKMEGNRQKEDEIYITEVVGLRLLLKELSSSKKLIVGHNCLLDLMFLTSQCFEALPENYEQFKALVHRTFPNVIDTKFIGTSDKFKEMFPSTVLNQLYERLTKDPFKKIEVEFENPFNTYSFQYPKEHEAGYDSYLTGYCLLVILKYLKVELSGNFEPNKCKELNPFLNRIALQRICNPFIYITGKEPTVTRTHVFFVTFPSTWQTSDIQDQFKNYGPVNISWVNNSSAFISLYNKENASCVMKTIAKPPGFEIKSFAQFQSSEKEKRDLSRKRKKENSESSESSASSPPCTGNGSKKEQRKNRKGSGKKKAFVEGDIW